MPLYRNFIEPTYKTTLKNTLIEGIKSALLGEFRQSDIDDFSNSINAIDNASSPEIQADKVIDDALIATANILADVIEQYIDERIEIAFSGHQHHQHSLALTSGGSLDDKLITLSENNPSASKTGSSIGLITWHLRFELFCIFI